VPAYADTASPDVPTPINTATPTPSDSATTRPSSSAAPRSPERTTQAAPGAARSAVLGTWIWVVLALGVAVLLGLVPAATRVVQRRRRLRELARGGASALTGWREILDSAADLGISVPDTATPRDAAELLVASLGGVDRGALDRMRAAVEHESYAYASGAGSGGGLGTVSTSLAADVRRVIGDLSAAADRGRRMRAALIPSSILVRMSRGLRVGG
jgi:hypothetical protein